MVFTLAVQELLNIEQNSRTSQQNHIYIYKEIVANSWYYYTVTIIPLRFNILY